MTTVLVYLWAPTGPDTVEARALFTQGAAVVEDPATGSACSNLGAWLVVFEVNSLCWKIDALKRADRFRRRQIFLAALDRALECFLRRTVDPDREIEAIPVGAFEQEYSFDQDDINVRKRVGVLSIFARTFFSEVGL